jgi:hypothetical protein
MLAPGPEVRGTAGSAADPGRSVIPGSRDVFAAAGFRALRGAQ